MQESLPLSGSSSLCMSKSNLIYSSIMDDATTTSAFSSSLVLALVPTYFKLDDKSFLAPDLPQHMVQRVGTSLIVPWDPGVVPLQPGMIRVHGDPMLLNVNLGYDLKVGHNPLTSLSY